MCSSSAISRMLSFTTCFMIAALAVSMVRGDEPAATPQQPAAAPSPYRVTGPQRYQNLAIYLIHGKATSDAKFITLQEGLASGKVSVSEKGAAQVSELAIENRSDQPLFLQEGDRLKGGQQDRTCYTSLVVKPSSGPTGLPAFCVEHGRWTAGASGDRFGSTEAYALAPQSVRIAAKVQKNQDAVWANVGEAKRLLSASLQAPNATSSLNEALDSPKTAAAVKGYVDALSKLLADQDDAIGVAIAVGERIEEVNVYANHELLTKIYPKLLESYASDAAARADVPGKGNAAKPIVAPPPPAEAVLVFMNSDEAKLVRDEKVNATNRLTVENLGGRFRCITTCEGQPVHTQWMRDVIRGLPAGAVPSLQLPPGKLIVPSSR